MFEVGSGERSISATDGVDRKHVRLVVFAALTSRILVWLLGVVAHSVAGPYDISHQAHDTHIHPAPITALDRVIRATIEPFAHWDGQHFMTIAAAGYEYEKEHAFFPFVPLVARTSGALIELMVPSNVISSYDAMLLGVFMITNLTFISAAVALLYLSSHVLQDRTLALRSALLFCITPASIFMSAVYTESYFALFSFCGLYCLVRRRYWTAALWIFGTCAVRSNGSLYVAYFIWDAFHTLIDSNIPLHKRILFVLKLATCSVIAIIPILAFQYYGYLRYCVERAVPQPYCSNLLPNVYSHVQARYWNVGFLAYYQVKQIPNFLLAGPCLAISIYGVTQYVSFDVKRFLTLGLLSSRESAKSTGLLANAKALPFYYQWTILLGIALTVLHVQVTTRFMSALAPLYWYAASLLFPSASSQQLSTTGKVILIVCLGYMVVGTCLFCTFLPWT